MKSRVGRAGRRTLRACWSAGALTRREAVGLDSLVAAAATAVPAVLRPAGTRRQSPGRFSWPVEEPAS